VVLHLIRVFVTAAYKRPREVNWLVGLGLLAITFGFAYTGTVIKWDQEGSEALAHNEAVATFVGRIGGWFSADYSVHVPLLTRVYFAHVAIFPALLTFWLIAHFYFIKVHGMAPLWRRKSTTAADLEAGDSKERYGEVMLPYTSHLRHMVGWGLLVFAIVAGLAAAFVPPLGPKPVQGIEVTKPPVYFYPFYGAEDLFGVKDGLLWFPLVVFGLLTAVLLVDRGPARGPGARKWVLLAGAIVLLVLIGLGIYAGVTKPVAHTQM
jgi:ubiquinol-cytochrome c reductase cytochrome b subunit